MQLHLETDLERLKIALNTIAKLVIVDQVYAPIFKRLEDEIAYEEALLANDILARARAIAAQSAIF